MAGKLGKFQHQTFTGWYSKVQKSNHLGTMFQMKPQLASPTIVRLLEGFGIKSFDSFVSKFPTKEFDSDEEYTWDVISSSAKNIPLVEARNIDGNPVKESDGNVGKNGEIFYLVFGEDYFPDGVIIVGELNEVYPIRVLGDGRNEGTNTVYRVQLTGGNTDGIPYDQVTAGRRFSIDFAPVSKGLSRQVGGIHFATPISMRNEFTTIRIHSKVSGDMLDKKIAFGIPIMDNKTHQVHTETMWMHYGEWQLEQEWADYKNKAIVFGRSNRNKNGEYMDFDKSGEVIRMGAGLFEQMEYGNTMPYNTFSLKLIEDALYQLSATKLGFGDRTFIMRTGERGALQFHKAVLDTVSGWTAFTVNADNLSMVRRTNSPLHENALSAGFQFVEFLAPNGVKLKVEVDPMYDDLTRNKISHYLGGPAFSYRYDIFDIGTMDQPNIFKVAVKGKNGDYTSYQWGLRDPWTGRMGNPYASTDEDSSTIHKMTTTGICVLDPTRTMSIIPSILLG